MSVIREDFSATALTNAIESNQIAYCVDICRSPQVELHETEEALSFISHHPYPRLNRVLHVQFESNNIERDISAVLVPFKSRKVPMLWHIGPSTRLHGLGLRLASHGLRHVTDEIGMAVDLSAVDYTPPMTTDFTIERVRNMDTLQPWGQTFMRAFGAAERAANVFVRIETDLLRQDFRCLYIGLLHGEPIATATLFFGAGVAGIYGVGTVPEVRRHGIGTAMTRTLLVEARDRGYRIGTLYASTMGHRMYRRLGFQDYCVLSRYMWSGSAN